MSKFRIPTDEVTLRHRLVVSYSHILMTDAIKRQILEGGANSEALARGVLERAAQLAHMHEEVCEAFDDEQQAIAKEQKAKDKERKGRE